ncbi:MAG: hypothetical protein ACLVGX_08555, partial [Oscillospiraceae bacterium]
VKLTCPLFLLCLLCCACFCGIAAGATSLAEQQRPHFPHTPVPARAVFVLRKSVKTDRIP